MDAVATERPMKAVTLQELDQLIEQMYDEQLAVEAVKTRLDEVEAVFNNTKNRVLSIFQEFNKPSYRTGRGMVVRQKRFTVAHPKDPEQKAKFYQFLKDKGIFEDMVTVHSQTLNSYYKAEMEAAIEAGATDFEMPGVGEPKMVEILVLRRK